MNAALVVEDLEDIRLWLERALLDAFPGVVVQSVATVGQALARVGERAFDVALVDLGLPDGNGLHVVRALRASQPGALPVVVTIYDDDEHLFPALQAGAFGYLLKEQPRELLVAQLRRIVQGEPPLSPPIARRVLAHFARPAPVPAAPAALIVDPQLTERETEVLQRVAKGFTLPEIAQQFGLSRYTVADHVKQIYRKLDVSSRAEAALEAARRGLVNP